MAGLKASFWLFLKSLRFWCRFNLWEYICILNSHWLDIVHIIIHFINQSMLHGNFKKQVAYKHHSNVLHWLHRAWKSLISLSQMASNLHMNISMNSFWPGKCAKCTKSVIEKGQRLFIRFLFFASLIMALLSNWAEMYSSKYIDSAFIILSASPTRTNDTVL